MRFLSADEGVLSNRPGATTPPRPRRRARVLLVIARTALGVGLIAWLARSGAIDWSRLAGLATAPHYTAGALALLFLIALLCSWRFSMLVAGHGLVLPLSASFRLTLIGALFNNVLPGSNGGDVVRMYLAARPNAGRRAEIAVTLVVDRMIGLLALLVTPLIVALLGGRDLFRNMTLNGLVVVGGLGSLVLIIALIPSSLPNSRFRRLANGLADRARLGRQVTRVFDAAAAMARSPIVLLRALALSLLIQALLIAAMQFILLANGATALSWPASLLTPFGMLANALPLTPGGLGVGEAAFEGLFGMAGVVGGAEAIMSWRLLTTFIDLGGGLILLAGRTEVKARELASAATGSVPQHAQYAGTRETEASDRDAR